MTLIWWVAVDPLAPYELAKLGVPATATAAWELPAWYLAKLWYGVLVKRCRKPEDLNVLHVRLGAAGPNKEQDEALREIGFNEAQIDLRRRMAAATTPEERIRVRIEAQEAAAKQRPVGR